MNSIFVFLMAITMNAQTGDEISRNRVKDSPVFQTIDDCVDVQRNTGFQHPKIDAGTRTITVIECVAVSSDQGAIS